MSADPFGELAEQTHLEELRRIEETPATPESDDVRWAAHRALKDTKIRYTWKPEDQAILAALRGTTNALIQRHFADVLGALDDLYLSIRTPKVNEHGVVLTGPDGRTVWETDERGNPAEDWSLLTGQDVEACLLNMSRVKFELAQRVSDLFTEALFAKHVYNDVWHEQYESMVHGTQKDREALANRETKQDRYFGFYRYTIWASADTLLKEVNATMRLLERVRDWRIRAGE